MKRAHPKAGMASFFFPVRFKTYVQLAPKDLTSDFEECILRKLRRTYEGVCSRYGYIKPASLRVLQRSAGQLMKPHFNGYIRFEAVLVGEVCNPTKGTVVEAVVKAKNNLGLLAESKVMVGGEEVPVLDIIVPKRSAGIASEVDLDTIAVRDRIFVEVMGKRYQLNDHKISIIGRVVKEMKVVVGEEEEVVADDGEGNDEEAFTDGGAISDDDADGDGDGDADGDGEEIKPAVKLVKKVDIEVVEALKKVPCDDGVLTDEDTCDDATEDGTDDESDGGGDDNAW